MEYVGQPNLLLEGLAYLGRKAAGRTWGYMEQRISQRKALPGPVLCETLEQLKALTERMDSKVCLKEETLRYLFGNLEGFAHNNIGSSSRAFFLLYPLLEQYRGDAADLARQLGEMEMGRVAWGIASIFEEDLPASGRLEMQEFVNLVLGLAAPDATKVALMELCRDYAAIGRRALELLTPALEVLEQSSGELQRITAAYARQCENLGPGEFFEQFSHLRPNPSTHYRLRPFVFGADTNLTFDLAKGQVCVYGGILRRELMELVSGRTSAQDQVCETYRLLGDSTRFDILCYLRSHNAYVQELSTRFGLSRNTIHHHMNKLTDCGLVRCTVEGNRMYYSLDSEYVQQFLQRQAALFGSE